MWYIACSRDDDPNRLRLFSRALPYVRARAIFLAYLSLTDGRDYVLLQPDELPLYGLSASDASPGA